MLVAEKYEGEFYRANQQINGALKTLQIKHVVKTAVTRRSSYDTDGIPTLDGDTQTSEQKLSGSFSPVVAEVRRPVSQKNILFSHHVFWFCAWKLCSKRKREPAVLSFEESERRALLLKDWTRYKTKQHRDEMTKVAQVRWSQQRALEELRKESEELYESAIQVNGDVVLAWLMMLHWWAGQNWC